MLSCGDAAWGEQHEEQHQIAQSQRHGAGLREGCQGLDIALQQRPHVLLCSNNKVPPIKGALPSIHCCLNLACWVQVDDIAQTCSCTASRCCAGPGLQLPKLATSTSVSIRSPSVGGGQLPWAHSLPSYFLRMNPSSSGEVVLGLARSGKRASQ